MHRVRVTSSLVKAAAVASALGSLAGLAGCNGNISEIGAAPGSTSTPGMTGGGGGGTGVKTERLDCSAARPARAPLRRLTRFEYNNTIRDLIGDTTKPADMLPGEEVGTGFQNEADSLGVSRLLIDGYRSVAHDIALRATATPAAVTALAGCDATKVGETACIQKFIGDFGTRAFRRPLDATDVTDLTAVFTTGRVGTDFASGLRSVMEVVLQSPEFMYRVEFGEPVDAAKNLGRPAPYEMASRLSYILWGTMPDATLFSLASQGKLRTKEDVLAQAQRMLADPRARDISTYFHGQLLGIRGLDGLQRVPDYYPTFTPGMGSLFRQETETFIDKVVWEGAGDFTTLMTAPFTYVNATLAKFYGIAGVTGDQFQRVDLDPAKRAGVMTQASLLAITTPGSRTNPVLRGKWIYTKMMCGQIEPPQGVVFKEPDAVMNETARQRFTAHRQPGCIGCHQFMDPYGFGLENYDGVGLWRDTDENQPIDPSGELLAKDGTKTTFSGPIQLAHELAAMPEVQSCFIGEWLTYAYGRVENADDGCSRQTLEDSFKQSKGNVKQLMLALTQTDAFLTRPATAP